MNTVSDRIRAAALGPTPRDAKLSIGAWVGTGVEWNIVAGHLYDYSSPLQAWLMLGSDDNRRLFLLNVAEAMES